LFKLRANYLFAGMIDKSPSKIFKVNNGKPVLETANAVVFAAVNDNFPSFINV
jgi:hypothetical protein